MGKRSGSRPRGKGTPTLAAETAPVKGRLPRAGLRTRRPSARRLNRQVFISQLSPKSRERSLDLLSPSRPQPVRRHLPALSRWRVKVLSRGQGVPGLRMEVAGSRNGRRAQFRESCWCARLRPHCPACGVAAPDTGSWDTPFISWVPQIKARLQDSSSLHDCSVQAGILEGGPTHMPLLPTWAAETPPPPRRTDPPLPPRECPGPLAATTQKGKLQFFPGQIPIPDTQSQGSRGQLRRGLSARSHEAADGTKADGGVSQGQHLEGRLGGWSKSGHSCLGMTTHPRVEEELAPPAWPGPT